MKELCYLHCQVNLPRDAFSRNVVLIYKTARCHALRRRVTLKVIAVRTSKAHRIFTALSTVINSDVV